MGMPMNQGFGLMGLQPLDSFSFINIGVGGTTCFALLALLSEMTG
jgi:hypothetical protein